MRRLYILLAAALIAASMLALVIGPAGAQGNLSKKYVALVLNEQTVEPFYAHASGLLKAQKAAKSLCKNDPSSTHDQYCEGIGWVKNGYINLWVEQQVSPHFPNWGYAWSADWRTARRNAEKYCEERISGKCYEKESVSTAMFSGSAS